MAEQATTTHRRPAIYRVATGNTLKGATVEILGSRDAKPLDTLRPNDKVWVREFTQFPAEPDATRSDDRLAEPGARLPDRDEKQLGRDFTDEEAAERERVMKLRVAQHMVDHRAESINNRLAQMAERLERAAEDMRRVIASEYRRSTKRSTTWPGCFRTWAPTA